jgi:hypothetical protein
MADQGDVHRRLRGFGGLLRDKGQFRREPFHRIQRPSITVGVRSPLPQRLFGLARRMSGKIIPTLFLLENAPFNALRTVSAAADVMRRGLPFGRTGFWKFKPREQIRHQRQPTNII